MSETEELGSESGNGVVDSEASSVGKRLPIPPTREELMGWSPFMSYVTDGDEAESLKNCLAEFKIKSDAAEEFLIDARVRAKNARKALREARYESEIDIEMGKESLKNSLVKLIEAIKFEEDCQLKLDSASDDLEIWRGLLLSTEKSRELHLLKQKSARNILLMVESLGMYPAGFANLDFLTTILRSRDFYNIKSIAFIPPDDSYLDGAGGVELLNLSSECEKFGRTFVVRSPSLPPSSPSPPESP